jgi:NADH-ubiquinone oxidoreductase chain 1
MVFFNYSIWLSMAGLSISTLILVARGSFPRFRYDKLIYVAWKGILPVILNILIFISGVILVIILAI